MSEFATKEEMLTKLRAYASNPDDINILYKEKIKDKLLKCPELLYSLNNKKYEAELFDSDGNIDESGDWSIYFGDNIRPFIFFPETQTIPKNYLCYKVEFQELPRYNKLECYGNVTFVIFCDHKDGIDELTGIPRHDLIASIVREKINWKNIFGSQCKLVSNKEGYSDANYITRTLVFEMTIPNALVKTTNGVTSYINK